MLVYALPLLLGGLPWSMLFVGPSWRCRRRRSWTNVDGYVGVVIGWLAMTIVFFLVAGSRNPTYLLPAYSPAAILAGKALADWLVLPRTTDVAIGQTLRILPVLSLALVAVLVLAVPVLHEQPALPIAAILTVIIIVLMAIVCRNDRFWARRSGCIDSDDGRHWRVACVAAQVVTGLVLVASTVLLVLPALAHQRCALPVVQTLRQIAPPSPPILWFNHLPPSALFYGPDLQFRRVYFKDIQQPPAEPTVFVTRASRLEEVLPTPLLAGAEHIDLGGKFHIFLCGRPLVAAGAAAEHRR